MNYGFVKNQVLKLLNQYTVAGDAVAESYNNQADYIRRIPSLTNDAMMEIATFAKKIPATMNLADLYGEDIGDQIRYALPADFYQFKSGDTIRADDGHVLHARGYMMLGKRYLVVDKEDAQDYTITYYRYPRPLPENPDDSDLLDNAPETHFAIPFYVASMLVAHDDSFLCSLFNNKYEDKLAKMQTGLSVDVTQTEDVYGGNNYGYIC